MAFEDIDRRRTLLLGLLTLIALPAIYFYSQRSESTADDPSSVTVEVAADVDEGPNRPPIVITEEDPTFLSGPVGEANPGVNEIAVPAQSETAPLQLSASYRSTVPGVRTCLLRNVGLGIPVTIKNLDNGRSVECVTAQAPEGQVADVVLHTEAFSRLADPTEAPITIELTQ